MQGLYVQYSVWKYQLIIQYIQNENVSIIINNNSISKALKYENYLLTVNPIT